jgi:hypothetical protein
MRMFGMSFAVEGLVFALAASAGIALANICYRQLMLAVIEHAKRLLSCSTEYTRRSATFLLGFTQPLQCPSAP